MSYKIFSVISIIHLYYIGLFPYIYTIVKEKQKTLKTQIQ